MPTRPTVRTRMGIEFLEDRLALSAGTTIPVPWSEQPSPRPDRRRFDRDNRRSDAAPVARGLSVASQFDEPQQRAVNVFNRINQERRQRGLEPLTFNPKLVEAAELHSRNMARRSDLVGPESAMQHTLPGVAQPTLESRLNHVGYDYGYAGENIAWGYSGPAEVVEAWMKSPGHRENILDPDFTEVGIGTQIDSNGNMFYTQVFAEPLAGRES